MTTVNITSNATNTFDATWAVSSKKDLPTATFFPIVLVQCETPSGGLDWCQFDSSNNKNYWASQKIDSVTPAMRAAVIVGSIIGPAFLIGYFVYDNYLKKQH